VSLSVPSSKTISSRDLGYNHQALYCWGKLSSLDPANVNAQWDRALLARDMGDLKTVRFLF
jgi:general transcription factor 3C polypeptide 3 (transcription factor C subunit 4)